MSSTTIKAIWPGEKAKGIAELRNAWGSAPFVWDAMCARYLGGNWLSQSDKLWPLWKDPRAPENQRAVLALTFDKMYLLKKDYTRAAADIRQFLADFPSNSERVNHWPAIAELLESDPDYPAIGFHMTSVAEDPWRGQYNEDADDYDPIDWSRAWSIYDELDKQTSQVHAAD